jgi:segregation and condensation protein B
VSDATSEPVEFIEHDRLISIIDSMLFATDKPVSVATMKSMFKDTNVRTRDIQRALDILASECAAPTRGMTLEEINGGYQYRTKVDNAAFLKRLGKARAFRLSGQALEVMSIIAYKQPVTKHEVDEIRGVESGHLVRALMERGLVSFQGKAENLPGKPMSYGTTRKFLEIFGLRNIKELPTLSEIDELIPEGIGEVEERETLSELTDKLSNQVTASYSEGEDELLKIHDSLQTIETSTEFFEQEKQRERNRRDEERARDIRERLLVEEAVEDKDRKWLARYEAKLNEAAALAAAGAMAAEAQAHEPGAHGALESEQATADDSVIADSELAGQLEALTQGKVDDDSLADDSFDDVDDLDIALNDDDLDDDSDVDTSDDV